MPANPWTLAGLPSDNWQRKQLEDVETRLGIDSGQPPMCWGGTVYFAVIVVCLLFVWVFVGWFVSECVSLFVTACVKLFVCYVCLVCLCFALC